MEGRRPRACWWHGRGRGRTSAPRDRGREARMMSPGGSLKQLLDHALPGHGLRNRTTGLPPSARLVFVLEQEPARARELVGARIDHEPGLAVMHDVERAAGV